jgi:cytochrome b561
MSANYHPISKTLHWTMSVLIIGLLALGLYMHELPLSPQKLQLYSWHKWFGVTVFMLVWLRLAWRIAHPAPPPPAALSPILQTIARATHGVLYGLMVLIPLSGWLMSSAKGFQTVWFGVLPIPDLVSRNKDLGELLQEVHEGLNAALMLTLSGHVVAALWHHFVLKDDTLRRMTTGKRS